MKELTEYREKLIARLGKAADEFCGECRASADPFLVVEGEWTLHQIASHMRDVDREVYGARIRRTLREDTPEFASFDADAWMAERYDATEALAKILDEFLAQTTDLCGELESAPMEAWSRESRHEMMGGGLTLQLWVERSLAHIEEHLRVVKHAKNG